MKKLIKRNILGNEYLEYNGSIYIPYEDCFVVASAGEVSFVSDIEEADIESELDDDAKESLDMLGFELDTDHNCYYFDREGLIIDLHLDLDLNCLSLYFENDGNEFGTIFAEPEDLIDSIIFIQDKFIFEDFEEISTNRDNILCTTYICAKNKINKNGQGRRNSTRDMTRNLQRVKSSNIWAYGFDLPEGEDYGQLFIQFKSKDGGPGDVYQYAEVPVKLWQKFIRTGSKGHFFWKYIRNNHLYRKLSGDKIGKLPNAVN